MAKAKRSPSRRSTPLQLVLISTTNGSLEGLSDGARKELRAVIAELLIEAVRHHRAEEGRDE